ILNSVKINGSKYSKQYYNVIQWPSSAGFNVTQCNARRPHHACPHLRSCPARAARSNPVSRTLFSPKKRPSLFSFLLPCALSLPRLASTPPSLPPSLSLPLPPL